MVEGGIRQELGHAPALEAGRHHRGVEGQVAWRGGGAGGVAQDGREVAGGADSAERFCNLRKRPTML